MPKFPVEVKKAAVAQVQEGRTVSGVAASLVIIARTIRKWVTAASNGDSLDHARRGPKPVLPEEAERHIHDWIVGRQLVGFSVDRGQILRK
ncbi:hypothetical protein L916_21837, partial [Phytophthora nicotianae]